MASTRSILLFCLFAFLLVGSSFAAKAAKDSKKSDTPKDVHAEAEPSKQKASEPVVLDTPPVVKEEVKPDPVEEKVAPKKGEEKPKEKKADDKKSEKKPKSASKSTEAGSTDQISEIVDKVKTHVFGLVERVTAFVQDPESSKLVLDNANRFVDKYFDVPTATWVRLNLFNLYGALAAVFAFIFSAFLVTRIKWIFSLKTLRAFLSSFGLGVFLTLFVISSLSKDPAVALSKNNPEIFENLRSLGLTWFTVLAILNLLTLLSSGGFGNFLQVLASFLPFAELFGFSAPIEAFTGPLSSYSLLVATFFILSLFSFGHLVPHKYPKTEVYVKAEKPVSVPAVSQSSARPSTPTKENKKKKRTD